MEKIRIIKKILGVILAVLFIPLICGFLTETTFLAGFKMGLIADVFILVIMLFALLVLWLFGLFEDL